MIYMYLNPQTTLLGSLPLRLFAHTTYEIIDVQRYDIEYLIQSYTSKK